MTYYYMSGWGEELKELTAELTHTLGYSRLLSNPTRSQQNNTIEIKNKRIKATTLATMSTLSLCGCQKLLASLTRFAKVFSIHAGMIA